MDTLAKLTMLYNTPTNLVLNIWARIAVKERDKPDIAFVPMLEGGRAEKKLN